jgi:hypothetical protein
MKIATGCQDGRLRVYNVCIPEQPPDEYQIGASTTEAVTKLTWSTTEPNTVLLGTRSGRLEKWDFRAAPATGPAVSVAITGLDVNIMDIETSAKHNTIMIAVGKKARTVFIPPSQKFDRIVLISIC